MIELEEKFGICLILPECAFTAEIPRDGMLERIQDIDDQLTEQGVPDENATRMEIMVDNARSISAMLASKQIKDNTVGISDIAYSFVYALSKVVGLDNLNNLRGLTGSFIKNVLRMNPCLAEFDFGLEKAYLSKKMEDHGENDDWDLDSELPPTYH